jgi:RimJ/RimL family protein N-acetyltransferase
MDNIKTERLELKPLLLEHAALLLPIWTDEEVVKNTYIQGVYNEENCKEMINRLLNISVSRNDIGPYAIFMNLNLIGIIGAARDSAFEYGLYYHLGKDYWGCGYATEAAKAIVDIAFNLPKTVRVSANARTTNPASSRVLVKIGMKFEGCMRMKFFRNGIFDDLNSYAILKSEYEKA